MEHRNSTDSNKNSCKNGYTSTEMFIESYGVTEESISRCNGCQNYEYNFGVMTCKKFDGNDEK